MRIIILLACLICTSMVGQDLKKKKKSGANYQELYTVDKNSKERQGYYFKIDKNSKDTLVKGTFEQGKKVGVWSFMDNKGSIYLEYDNDQKELLQNAEKTLEGDSIQVKLRNQFQLLSVDHPPIFIGYKNEIKDIINEEMKPPPFFFQEGKSGVVVISFAINQIGEAVNFNIESTFNDKINESVLNSVERIKYQWVPAAINGTPVVSKMYMIFNFITDPNIGPKSKFEDKADLIVVDLTYMAIENKRSTTIRVQEMGTIK